MEYNPIHLDIVWVLFATALVFLMQAGFAMLEAGATRAKNAANIIMKNVMDISIWSLVFWMVGFGFMFGANKSGWIGTNNFFLSEIDPSTDEGMFDFAFFIFQTVFAATAATIISGAVAERTKFIAYLMYTVAVTAFIYPVFGSWVWGGGWLSGLGENGFIDFAGSTVVHSVGGWAALAGAIVVGPRLGKFAADKSPLAIPGHSITLAALGVFVLWFGWFGFNAGSTVSGNDASIAIIMVTTNLAAAAGALGALSLSYLLWKRFDASMTLNGVIGGLFAITAGTANMSPGMAALTGLIGGMVVVGAVLLLERGNEGRRPGGCHCGPRVRRCLGHGCGWPVRFIRLRRCRRAVLWRRSGAARSPDHRCRSGVPVRVPDFIHRLQAHRHDDRYAGFR